MVQDCGRADYLCCFDSGNNDNKMHVFSKREFYDLLFLISIFMFLLLGKDFEEASESW
jgi:hypothetical protein